MCVSVPTGLCTSGRDTWILRLSSTASVTSDDAPHLKPSGSLQDKCNVKKMCTCVFVCVLGCACLCVCLEGLQSERFHFRSLPSPPPPPLCNQAIQECDSKFSPLSLLLFFSLSWIISIFSALVGLFFFYIFKCTFPFTEHCNSVVFSFSLLVTIRFGEDETDPVSWAQYVPWIETVEKNAGPLKKHTHLNLHSYTLFFPSLLQALDR